MINNSEYSEIADTSCGTSIFAAGDKIYQLNGVDLASRELDVVDMTADPDCTFYGAPATGDCYRWVLSAFRRKIAL